MNSPYHEPTDKEVLQAILVQAGLIMSILGIIAYLVF